MSSLQTYALAGLALLVYEWLASGRRDGFQAFCPNADFIGRCAP